MIRSKDSGAYDLGELDQALFLYLDGQSQDHHNSSSTATTTTTHHLHQDTQRRKHLCRFISPSISLSLALYPLIQRERENHKENNIFCFFSWPASCSQSSVLLRFYLENIVLGHSKSMFNKIICHLSLSLCPVLCLTRS